MSCDKKKFVLFSCVVELLGRVTNYKRIKNSKNHLIKLRHRSDVLCLHI
jgi:hypothetical protein